LIPNLLALFRDLLRDPRVPRSAKIWLGVGVAWIASPVDLIPEFIPIAGPLDDAIVAALVLRHLIKLTPPAVVAEHWRGDQRTLRVMVGCTRVASVVAHSVRVGDRDDEVGGGGPFDDVRSREVLSPIRRIPGTVAESAIARGRVRA
jgi:uncharacterized membrane protein YkvA (DUF1232 family)